MKTLKHIGIAVMMLGLMFVLVIGLSTSASAETYGDLTYTISYYNEVTITDCSITATEVVIPETIDGYPVTSIGSYAFSSCSSLTSITIPDGVTSIGDYAFQYCTRLTSISIPDSVTSIRFKAFFGCSSLTSMTIPDSVTSIGVSAFSGCSSLENITIPDSVTSIGSSAFDGCSSLTNITIPDGVTSIGSFAFDGCSSLERITIPDSVTSIGSYAFDGCSLLTSVTIPDGVTSIGEKTFNGCSSLISVTIPDGVTSIGYEAFRDCYSLASITIPDSVTSIGKWAFYYCSSLERITIPDGVTSIGSYAFCDCSSLISVTILDGVTSIGDSAFSGCSSLENITIPNSVTSIGEKTFFGCSSLTSITIPNSVTSIGADAFYNCSSLASINIPEGVTSIGSSAFSHCSSLTSIIILNTECEIYDSVLTIYSGAKIYGYSGSTAEAYAEKYNRNFVVLDEDDSSLQLIITADKSVAEPTDIITYTVALSPVQNLAGLEFQLVIPDGLTFVAGSFADGLQTKLGAAMYGFNVNNQKVVIVGNMDYTSTELTTILTFTCTVAKGFTGELMMNVDTDSLCFINPTSEVLEVVLNNTDSKVSVSCQHQSWADATCTAPATCTRCGETQGEALRHNIIINNAVEPTCTQEGLTDGSYCSICDVVIKTQEIIPAFGHNIIITPGDEATCTTSGYTEGSYCSRCNDMDVAQQVIPALGHDIVIDNAVSATCTQTGLTEGSHCSRCFAMNNLQYIIPALGHNVVVVTGVEATCTETGLTEGRYCSVCDEVLATQEEIPVLGHDWESSVCNRCGETDGVIVFDTSVTLSNVTGRPGETVEVYVSFSKDTDVKTMSISDIVYDSEKLTLVNGEWLVDGSVIADWNLNEEVGVITFAENTTLNSNVFVLTFEIKENLEDCETVIDCVFGIKAMNENNVETALSVEVIPGSVNITNIVKGDITGDDYVDSNDAIHLLYHTMLPDRYEINQDCDFDGNGYVDSNDAIYLLYHTMLPERYPLG